MGTVVVQSVVTSVFKTTDADSSPCVSLSWCLQFTRYLHVGPSSLPTTTRPLPPWEGQRSLDCFCRLLWHVYCNGGRSGGGGGGGGGQSRQPCPGRAAATHRRALEGSLCKCRFFLLFCDWLRRQVPVLWLASQQGISPHLETEPSGEILWHVVK